MKQKLIFNFDVCRISVFTKISQYSFFPIQIKLLFFLIFMFFLGGSWGEMGHLCSNAGEIRDSSRSVGGPGVTRTGLRV